MTLDFKRIEFESGPLGAVAWCPYPGCKFSVSRRKGPSGTNNALAVANKLRAQIRAHFIEAHYEESK